MEVEILANSSPKRTTSNAGRGTVKKLVIKNFKEKPKLPDNFEEVTWEKLKTAINAIHNKQPIEGGLEELYKACENLCYHNMQASLYNRLQNECELHIKRQLEELLTKGTRGHQTFLEKINRIWSEYTQQMLLIRSIFLYLDRTYVLHTQGLNTIWEMSLSLFRKHILSQTEIKTKTIDGLLSLITNERKGESIDRSLMKSLIRMFVDLQVYPDFEKPFIYYTETFYRAEGNKLINEIEVPPFLEHVERRLKEEIDRVINYLDGSTRKPLLLTTEATLLKPHVNTLLEKGFDSLADDSRYEDLTRMFTLLSKVDELLTLKAFFGVYIKKKGADLVTAGGERDKTLVQDLIEYKDKMDLIVEKSFHNNPQFHYSLKESFENFINIRQNKPAELIAKFIDEKLKAGNKASTEEELEYSLDKALALFRFIQGKDVFEAFYKKDLAKRLLLSKSASVDAEKSMLSKLKTECGSGFTSKLEGMFKDIDISKDIMNAFNSSTKFKTLLGGFDLSVHVLTASFWPTYPPVEVHLPPEMAKYQEVFRSFYLTQHSGKKLMWQNNLGSCVLKSSFPSGNKELSVSLFQAIVLLLFNHSNQALTTQEIQSQTNIEITELLRTLQSLACGKVRILVKSPKGKDVNETDKFVFNSEFKHQLTRIKVNAIQLKETVEEQKETEERVFSDRQYQVDAAIVRIMKMRKKLSHNLLISELYTQLKFPVKPVDLKKRIESLIDREYLERDKTNPSEYLYLA